MIIALPTGSSRSAGFCRSPQAPTIPRLAFPAASPPEPLASLAHAAKRADPGKLSARVRRDANLQTDIKRVWDTNFQVYGVRKVWRQLQREAITAPRCQVARRGARQDGEDHAQRQIGAVPA
jgi:hypothetical protein